MCSLHSPPTVSFNTPIFHWIPSFCFSFIFSIMHKLFYVTKYIQTYFIEMLHLDRFKFQYSIFSSLSISFIPYNMYNIFVKNVFFLRTLKQNIDWINIWNICIPSVVNELVQLVISRYTQTQTIVPFWKELICVNNDIYVLFIIWNSMESL